MTNGEFFKSFEDECPVHGTELKAEYEFGKYRDSAVFTFTGCSCAVCIKRDGFKNSPQYYTSYSDAASRAKMVKALASVY